MSLLKLTLPMLVLLGATWTGWPVANFQIAAEASPQPAATTPSPNVFARPPTAQRAQIALARDAATFREDVALTNACVESGQNKTDCLCVTRVLKYELSLLDYRAAAQTRFIRANADSAARRAAKRAPNYGGTVGYSDLHSTLIAKPDFGPRCVEAESYFQGTLQPQ